MNIVSFGALIVGKKDLDPVTEVLIGVGNGSNGENLSRIYLNLESISFKIVLTQGLNRQIRRMCEYLDYEVSSLKRIRIINITLDVPVGKYRPLTDKEIIELNTLIEPSSKTEEASLPKIEPVKRRTEFIKKDDPRYKKPGDY